MGIKIKEGKTYELSSSVNNPSASTAHGDYYGHIKEYQYSALEKHLSFRVLIYGNESFAPKNVENANPLDGININVNPANFDADVGSAGITIAQLYAMALASEAFENWESDE